jgi:ketosteroid isomerase-like protein
MSASANGTCTPEELARRFDQAWARKDVDGVVGLYAADATIESPLIWHLMRKGAVRGHEEIRALVKVLVERGSGWGRHEPPVVRGNTMFVEYRRATPEGEQLDYVDVFEIDGGQIKNLRAYWGWRSLASSGATCRDNRV